MKSDCEDNNSDIMMEIFFSTLDHYRFMFMWDPDFIWVHDNLKSLLYM